MQQRKKVLDTRILDGETAPPKKEGEGGEGEGEGEGTFDETKMDFGAIIERALARRRDGAGGGDKAAAAGDGEDGEDGEDVEQVGAGDEGEGSE